MALAIAVVVGAVLLALAFIARDVYLRGRATTDVRVLAAGQGVLEERVAHAEEAQAKLAERVLKVERAQATRVRR